MYLISLIALVISGTYIIYKDTKDRIIPNWINLLLLLLGIVVTVFDYENWMSHVLGFFIVGGVMLSLAIITKGFGMGDVKYMFVIGLILGLASGLSALACGVIIGGLYSGIGVALKKLKMTDHIAYGPFLVIGAIIGHLYPFIT